VANKLTQVLELVLKTRGGQDSTKFFDNIGQGSRRAGSTIDAFGTKFSGLRDQTAKTEKIFGNFGGRISTLVKGFGDLRGMSRSLAPAFGALIGAKVTSEVVQMINLAQSLTNKLRVVSTSVVDLEGKMEALSEVARNTRGDLDGTITMFQRLTFAANRMGASQDQVALATQNLNKLMAIQGVQMHEARSILLQLSQGFQSGRLQGDEFRAISETLPPLLDILADKTGFAKTELKKLASEGFLKPKLILEALLDSTEKTNAQFAKTSVTLAQMFNMIKTEITAFTMAFANLESVKGFITSFAYAAAKALELLGAAIMFVIKPIDLLIGTFVDLVTFDFQGMSDRFVKALTGVDNAAQRAKESTAQLKEEAKEADVAFSEYTKSLELLQAQLKKEALLEARFADLDPEQIKIQAQEAIQELKPIGENFDIPLPALIKGLDEAEKKLQEFAKNAQAVEAFKKGGPFGLDRSLSEISAFQEKFQSEFAIMEENGKLVLKNINESNREELEQFKATNEELVGFFIQQQADLLTVQQDNLQKSKEFVNKFLFDFDSLRQGIILGTKQAFSAFLDNASQAYAGAILAGKGFKKATKKILVDFARQMIATLIKLAIQMLIVRAIAGMGFPTTDISKVRKIGSQMASFVKLAKGGVVQGGLEEVPSFANGGVVKRPTFAMIGDNPSRQEAVIPMQGGRVPVDMQNANTGTMMIENLSILPGANIDQALMDKPMEFFVDLVQEKILPALNIAGQSGATTTLEFRGAR
jgi:tape measure domain-containing protein